MAQTMKNQNAEAAKRAGRPGQRQQERLQRLARRRRRRLITTSVVIAVILVGVVALGFWQFERYSADQVALSNQHATATATTKNKQATATANAVNAQATATVSALSAALTPPPDSPPAVSGTPTKTDDGLQYIDIKEGTGPAAKAGDDVTVFYTGWIQSTGKKFDSSYDDNKAPFDVKPLGQANIIKGWNEGLIGVKAGGVRRLIIPASLGYGDQAQGPIPANATLVFDITIVSVKS